MFYLRFVGYMLDRWTDFIGRSRLVNPKRAGRYSRNAVTFSPWMRPGGTLLMAPPALLFIGAPLVVVVVYIILLLPDGYIAPVGIAVALLLLVYSVVQIVRLLRPKRKTQKQ